MKRVTIEEGKRAWEYKGRFYDSLKELDMVTNPSKYIKMNFTPKVEEDVTNIVENLISNNDENEDFQTNESNERFVGGPTEVTFLPNIDENNKEIK